MSANKTEPFNKFLLLFSIIMMLCSCQSAKEEEEGNKLKKFADGINAVHDNVRKFDSTMNRFTEGAQSTAKWLEEYKQPVGDTVTNDQ